jgi:hypothetical protein
MKNEERVVEDLENIFSAAFQPVKFVGTFIGLYPAKWEGNRLINYTSKLPIILFGGIFALIALSTASLFTAQLWAHFHRPTNFKDTNDGVKSVQHLFMKLLFICVVVSVYYSNFIKKKYLEDLSHQWEMLLMDAVCIGINRVQFSTKKVRAEEIVKLRLS